MSYYKISGMTHDDDTTLTHYYVEADSIEEAKNNAESQWGWQVDVEEHHGKLTEFTACYIREDRGESTILADCDSHADDIARENERHGIFAIDESDSYDEYEYDSLSSSAQVVQEKDEHKAISNKKEAQRLINEGMNEWMAEKDFQSHIEKILGLLNIKSALVVVDDSQERVMNQ